MSSSSSSSTSSSYTSSSSPFTYNFLSTGSAVGNAIKWRSIVEGADGKLYCAPYYVDSVLVIDPADDSVSQVTLSSLSVPQPSNKRQRWVDGLLAPNGKMYFNPHNGSGWLILDTSGSSLTASTVGGLNQTRGGAIDTTGVIHSTQFSGNPPLKEIFRLDTNTDSNPNSNLDPALTYATARTGGIYTARPNWETDNAFGVNYDSKWGVTAAPNGKLYTTPFGASRILITDPVSGLTDEGVDALTGNAPLPTELAFPSPLSAYNANQKPPFFAKYTGGTLDPVSGNIYAMPRRANAILKIDTATDRAYELPLPSALISATETSTSKSFSSLLGPDGRIYSVPWDKSYLMWIDPATDEIGYEDISAPLALSGSPNSLYYTYGVTSGDSMYFAAGRASNILVITLPPFGETSSSSSSSSGSYKEYSSVSEGEAGGG